MTKGPECCGCNYGELPCTCPCHVGEEDNSEFIKKISKKHEEALKRLANK